MSNNLNPPPSLIDLVPDNKQADYQWKKWFSLLWNKLKEYHYANVHGHDQTTVTVVSTISTWYQVTNFTVNGPSSNLIPDYTNSHITITENGDYKTSIALCIDGVGGGGASFDISAFRNNGATELVNVHASQYLNGGSKNDAAMAAIGINTLTQNDTIEVWIMNTSNTNNVIVTDVSLTIEKVN